MDTSLFLQLTINGILLGAFYATMTMGFSIIWGVMRLINLAHGEFLLMAAYVGWFFFNPTREQDLIIGGGDPEEVTATTQLIFAGSAGILGFVLSEIVLLDRFGFSPQDTWRRRATGFGAAAVGVAALYIVWESQDFATITLSMMNIIMVGLALSVGFIMSHIALKEVAFQMHLREGGNPDVPPENALSNIWARRALGYAIGAAAAFGIYQLWKANDFQSIDPFVAIPLVIIIFFALGYVMQRTLFNRLVEGPYLTMLLVTFALKIILQNLGLRIYAADPRSINIGYANSWSLVDDLTLSKVKFLTAIAGVVVAIVLILFLNRTRIGRAIRAAAQHKMAARLMGIDIKETYAITFGVALAITAIAGVLMGTFQPITPITGDPWTLRAFAIVALGGLGRVQGVIFGGMVLGLVESYIGGYWSTGWAITAAFIILVLMLLIRPQGLAGGLDTAEE